MAIFQAGFVSENARNLETKASRTSDLIPADTISGGARSNKFHLRNVHSRQRTDSFSQLFGVTYHVPGTVLDARDRKASNFHKDPPF